MKKIMLLAVAGIFSASVFAATVSNSSPVVKAQTTQTKKVEHKKSTAKKGTKKSTAKKGAKKGTAHKKSAAKKAK